MELLTNSDSGIVKDRTLSREAASSCSRTLHFSPATDTVHESTLWVHPVRSENERLFEYRQSPPFYLHLEVVR
jgi:hypothetical protein